MEDFYKKIKGDFYNINMAKKYLIALVILIGFLYFQSKISLFIENYLMSKPTYDSKLLDILIFGGCVIIIVFFYKKLLRKKYLPSTSEYFIVGILLSILIYNRFNLYHQDWNIHNFIETEYFNIKHIDLLIFLLSIYLFFNLCRYIRSLKLSNNINLEKNLLLNDDPISKFDDDKLDYDPIVNKLSHILLNENHTKSISIGLVGPWGNGKSSVIHMVKNTIEADKKYIDNDIISIHFLPYLNHNENDIINEFFTTLSNELSNYNGKLSNQLLNYSQKLTDLYKEKNITNFIENQITNFSKTSANELYEKIDKTLEEVNKKIIVFIDDLDRLNQNEILQVLKLIRNTANFRNTFFVVAMDKEYVINRLKTSDDVLNTKFIDKFFQLEIYLPEIDKNILRNYFVSELKKPFENSPIDFDSRIDIAINKKELLFNDYIKNFRDVKRVINQVKYDISLYKEDFSYLNLKDFINFTFFKLKFPKYMKDFNDNRDNFLEFDSSTGTYNLIRTEKEGKEIPRLDFSLLNTRKLNDIEYLNKYKIYNEKQGDEFKNEKQSLNSEDIKLLIKTLAFLFGDENKIEGTDSIKYENNFRMLMQQRIFKNYFKQSEFEELFINEIETLKSQLYQLEKSEKLVQLIDRLKYFNTSDEEKIKSLMNILIILYEKRIDFTLYEVDLLNLIEKFITEFFKITKEKKEDETVVTTWIEEALFNNDNFLEETRLTLLGYTWKSKELNNRWNLSDEFIIHKTSILYTNYLDKYQGVLWDVNNYKSYAIYHAIKIINIEEVNTIYKNFWERNSIELLCAQTVDLNSFSNANFNITNTVNEMFGNRNEFIKFIKSHKDKEYPAVKEFLKLFNLLQIINFSDSVIFEFKVSKLMLDKITYVKNHPGRSTYSESDNLRQIFIETNNTNLTGMILKDDAFDQDHPFRRFLYNKKDYIVITFKKQEFEEKSLSFIKGIFDIYPNSNIEFKETSIDEDLLIQIDETYLKIISIQPPKDSQEPNYEIY